MDSANNPLTKNHYYQIENHGRALYMGMDRDRLHTFEWQNAVGDPVIIKRMEEWPDEHPPIHIGANKEPVSHKMRTRRHKKGLGGKTKKVRGGSPSPPDKKKPLRGLRFSEMMKKLNEMREERKRNPSPPNPRAERDRKRTAVREAEEKKGRA
jgi:hypothetical protein